MWINLHTHLDRGATDTIEVCQWNVVSPEMPLKNKISVYSVGLHPSDALMWNHERKQKMHAMIDKSNVAFIGEIGLDASIGVALDVQKAVFSDQLSLASNNSLPVILHMVKCYDVLLQIKKHYQQIPAWVIHGFRGKPELMKQLLDHGFYLSFGTKFNEESLKRCPLNRLFLETDVHEQSLKDLYEKTAVMKGCDDGVLKAAIFSNFKDITGYKKGVNHIK